MGSLALVGRLLISLAFVLGVMWLIARRVRKQPSRVRNTKLIDVIGRQQLTKGSSIAVVRILDQALVIGVTDGHVSVLGEADIAKVEAHVEAAPERTPIRIRMPRLTEATAGVPAASRPLPPNRPAPVAASRPETAAATAADATQRRTALAAQVAEDVPPRKSALAGSALSPGTWRATVDSIRDLTVRSR
jgi:flagellar protein FliO/FliZ